MAFRDEVRYAREKYLREQENKKRLTPEQRDLEYKRSIEQGSRAIFREFRSMCREEAVYHGKNRCVYYVGQHEYDGDVCGYVILDEKEARYALQNSGAILSGYHRGCVHPWEQSVCTDLIVDVTKLLQMEEFAINCIQPAEIREVKARNRLGYMIKIDASW